MEITTLTATERNNIWRMLDRQQQEVFLKYMRIQMSDRLSTRPFLVQPGGGCTPLTSTTTGTHGKLDWLVGRRLNVRVGGPCAINTSSKALAGPKNTSSSDRLTLHNT